MPVYVTNPLDRTVTLHAADGDTIQIPPKTRDIRVHRKFNFMVPDSLRLRDVGDVARHERDHVAANEPEVAEAAGIDVPAAESDPAPKSQDSRESKPKSSGEGSSSSGAPPPSA